MFWIKFLLAAIIVVIVLLLGIEFAALNSDLVRFNYIVGTAEWHLSFIIICAFAIGCAITALITFLIVMPLRWRIARLQRTVVNQEKEITSLLKKPSQI